MKTFFRLLSLLKPFASEILLSLLLGVATIASGIGLLGTSAYLIASAALHPSIAELQVAIVGVRFFGISRGVFRYLERLVSHSVNLRILAKLRADFYTRIEPDAPANLFPFRSGDVLGRVMGDLETLENFYVRVISPAIVALVITAGVSLFIGGYLREIGFILASGLIITGFILPGVTVYLSKTHIDRLTRAKADLSSGIVETIQGLEDLQACNAQEIWFEKLHVNNHVTGKIQIKLTTINSVNSGIYLLLMNLTILGILWVAIPVVSSGGMSGVSLAVVMLLAMASFEATLTLPSAAQNLNASLVSGKRLFEIGGEDLTGVQTPKSTPTPEGQRLVFEGVKFSYGDGQPPILDGLDLVLEKGKKIAVVGASGEGKTSILNLLLRFCEPKSGRVTLDGVDITSLDPAMVRSKFGVMMQATYLFNTSLRENLLLAKPDASVSELNHALSSAELSDWVASLPDGLDTWVGEHGVKLSAGERQRVALARLVLQDAPFLLLDEPTSNLDPINENRIMKTLYLLFWDRGILLITHRLNLLKDMDEILVLQNAGIIERGKFLELMSSNGKFKSIYDIGQDLLTQ